MGKLLYALQTKKGVLEVTKGTYLSFKRRQQKELKTKSKSKFYQTQSSNDSHCCSIRTVRISKNTKSKALTVKKHSQNMYNRIKTLSRLNNSQWNNSPFSVCSQQSLSQPIKYSRFNYHIYDDNHILPKQFQDLHIPMCYDNDCQSDDEQIHLAVDNLIMSFSLALFDNKYYKNLS